MKFGNSSKRYLVFGFLVFAIACIGLGVRAISITPEKAVESYIMALNERDYDKAYSYLDISNDKYISKRKFSEKLKHLEEHANIDNYGYFSKVAKPIKSLEVRQLNSNSLKQIGNNIDLISVAALKEEYLYKCAIDPQLKKDSWGIVNVILYRTDNTKFITTVAVKRNESILGMFFRPFLIIDPCVIKRINISVEKDTQVELDGVKLVNPEELGIDSWLYKAIYLVPGEYSVKLSNPNAEQWEKKIRVYSFPKLGSQYELRGRMIFKSKLTESIKLSEKENSNKQTFGFINTDRCVLRKEPSFRGDLAEVVKRNNKVKVMAKKELSPEEKNRAVLEKDKLKIMLNGKKQYTLVDGGPIDIIEEKDGQYKCEVIMQGRSNFFLAPVNEIHRLNQDVWYLLETEDGKHGWLISKYVTLQ